MGLGMLSYDCHDKAVQKVMATVQKVKKADETTENEKKHT
jgi:hypothetical protein